MSVPPKRSAPAITAVRWVILGLRNHAGIASCLGHPAFAAEVSCDVLQASRSSFVSLLRGRPRMLWSPSSFEGEGKRGAHGTFHQFQQLQLRSLSAANAAHSQNVMTPG